MVNGSSKVKLVSRRIGGSGVTIRLGQVLSRLLALGVVSAIALSSCGSGGEGVSIKGQEGGPSGSLDGYVGNSLSIAATQVGSGAAVVAGGTSRDGGGLGPGLWWLPPADGEPEFAPLPLDEPLFDVSVFSAGSELIIVGLPCPTWTSPASPPDIQSNGRPFVSDVCGTDEYIVGRWDSNEKAWLGLVDVALRADDGVSIVDSSGARAVVETVSADPEGPAGRAVEAALLAVDDQTLEPLPRGPGPAGDADSTFTTCINDGGVHGLLRWSPGAEPPGVADGTWPADLALEADLVGQTTQVLLGLVVRGGAWEPVPAEGASSGAQTSPVCTEDGILVADLDQASRVVFNAERADWSPLGELPRAAPGIPSLVTAPAGTGPPLAVALEAPPDRPETADGPRLSPLWQLEGAQWLAQGEVPYSSGWQAVIRDGGVVNLLPVDDGTAQGGTRVDLT
ncbi:MAG: hypothetical protein ACR2JF_17325 [Iamia sp.]